MGMNILFDLFVIISLLCISFTTYFLYVVIVDAYHEHKNEIFIPADTKFRLQHLKDSFWYHFPKL